MVDTWEHLSDTASGFVALHLQTAIDEPGTVGGPDAAWRSIMRDILAAAVSEFEGDIEAAIGALVQGLDHAATELRVEVMGRPFEPSSC